MFFRLFIAILLSFSFFNAFAEPLRVGSDDANKYVKTAETMLSQLRPLADYMESNNANLEDEQLSLLREEVYKDYDELSEIEMVLDDTIQQREREIKKYNQMIPKGSSLDEYSFKNEIVARRYARLAEDLSALIEAKVYVSETKRLLSEGIVKLSETRIQTRNKDFFNKDESLIEYHAWQKGFQEIKSNFNLAMVMPAFWVIFISVVIYNICLLSLSMSFRFVKSNLSSFKDRKILNKISIFLRLFWCVFVASGVVLLLDSIFSRNSTDNYIVYMVCIYFIVQNTMIISLRVFGVYLGKKSLRIMRSLVLMIVTLLTIQGIDFFSLATSITPMFGRYGNTILSSAISLCLVVTVFAMNKRLYSARVNALALNIFRLSLLIVAIIYFALAFMGRDNLATGMTLDILQVQLVVVAGYSIYSLMSIIIYLISAKLRKVESVGAEVISRVRNYSNELVAEYWLRMILLVSFGFLCIALIFMILGVPYQQIQVVLQGIFFEGFSINAEKHFPIFGMLKSVAILVLLLLITKAIQKIAVKNILPYTNVDAGTQKAIQTAINYIGIFISLLVFIYSFGIDGKSLAFIISGLSVGFGFAMQDLVKNFFAGLTLLAERPIKVGDWINIHNEIGVVRKIRIRSTVIETFNHNTLIIPNGLFMNEIVSNETFNPMSRIVLNVGVSLDSNSNFVINELLAIAKEHKDVYKTPKPFVYLDGYGDYTLNFSLRAFCSKQLEYDIASELRVLIHTRFKELGINIPVQTSNVVLQQAKGN